MRYKELIALVLVFSLLGLVILAQDEGEEDRPILQIAVLGQTCDMSIVEDQAIEATPEAEATVESEATPEPDSSTEADEEDYPIISVGEDCDDLIPLLHVARNERLWIALSVPDEEDWQQFEPYEEDDYPPLLDGRGRFIGCSIPQEGEQVCNVLWELEGTVYRVEIPIIVGEAYVAPANTVISTEEPDQSTGEWGACGSCTSCDADPSQCVLNPQGMCVADPAHCGASSGSSSGSGSRPPRPSTTEEAG